MTDQLRTLAEAEAEREGYTPFDHERGDWISGFIAGRTSVTRDQIAAALAEPGAMGVQNHDLRQADRVLALLNGESDD